MKGWLGVGEWVRVWGMGNLGDGGGCVGVVDKVVEKCRWILVESKGLVVDIAGEMWEGVW